MTNTTTPWHNLIDYANFNAAVRWIRENFDYPDGFDDLDPLMQIEIIVMLERAYNVGRDAK